MSAIEQELELLQNIDSLSPRQLHDQYVAQVNALHIPQSKKDELLAEFAFRMELHEEIVNLAKRKESGEDISYDDMAEIMDRIAQKHGFEGGIPLPHITDKNESEHPLVMADHAPLSIVTNATYRTEYAQRVARTWKTKIINSWDVLGDHTVSIVRSENGPMWMKEYQAGTRLRKLLADIAIRSDVRTMTAEAELRAMESLKEKINAQQYRTYVLSGMFIERSPRSDLHYIFRKGRPTLVLSFHGEEAKEAGGRVIAALCMHAMGFYQFSHVGVCCPSDEVIAQLLYMRGDEHGFWKKSGQWKASDPRSGI